MDRASSDHAARVGRLSFYYIGEKMNQLANILIAVCALPVLIGIMCLTNAFIYIVFKKIFGFDIGNSIVEWDDEEDQ